MKKFRRHPELVRLGKSWRKPKSRTNKVRKGLKGKKPRPLVGRGAKGVKKFIHPSGLYEVMVSDVKGIERLDREKECARISGGIGKRKRLEIVMEAEKNRIKVLNPGKKSGVKK